MRVNRYDYPGQFGTELHGVLRTMEDTLINGHYGVSDRDVSVFEQEFADWLGVAQACGVNTGTDALILALLAAGVGPGDEVIAPANTFHATVCAILWTRARPVLVDCDPDSYLMDVAATRAAITPRTRAIIPVSLYGKAFPVGQLTPIAAANGISIVEDAAQAHGAIDPGGKVAGTGGQLGCFSFHPSKNLAAAGDGGIVVTDDAAIARQVRLRRALGQRDQNDHVVVGLNSKLHALQAIVLRAKLPKLAGWNQRRRELAGRYRAALAGLPVAFQREDAGERHVYHLFQVRTAERDALLTNLREHGIDAVVRYPTPIHEQPAFAECGWRRGMFPVAERLAGELLCLPLHPGLSDGDLKYVTSRVSHFFGR